MSDLFEKRIESSLVYSGALLKVKQDRVRLPDGREGCREYINHPGASVIIAFLENGSLLLERQFRYPLNRVFVEMPAGKIDRGESPLECARRELLEETGYEAETWREVATLHPCIGYSDERLVYFEARGLKYSRRNTDDEEFIESFELPLDTALEQVRDGLITDAKTVAGLLWAEKIAKGEWT